MSLYDFNLISTYSIVFAAVAAGARFRSILKDYRPFCYFLWIGLLNEAITTLAIRYRPANLINGNVYVLIEFFVILWFFKSRNQYQKNGSLILLLACITVAIWTGDNLLVHSIKNVNSFYRVWYSFVLIFLSIDQINFVLLTERRKIVTNAMFIICSAFLLFFSFKCFYEVFYLAHLSFSSSFNEILFYVYLIINLISNFLYFLGTLWIPTKQKFYIPY